MTSCGAPKGSGLSADSQYGYQLDLIAGMGGWSDRSPISCLVTSVVLLAPLVWWLFVVLDSFMIR